MKSFIAFALVTTFSFAAMAQSLEVISPLNADLDHPNDDRLIEPTSPILGKNLVLRIKSDKRHPEIILKELREEYPTLNREIQLASIAYFKTLVNPLKTYCTTAKKEESNDKAIEVVETAAIPIEVLAPLHENYTGHLQSLRNNYVEKSASKIEDQARKSALAYQNQRYDCDVVHQLDTMESKIKKYLPKRFDKLVDLHHKVSSPEAAFPRIQFSVNGFTQHVFGELFKIPYARLSGILKVVYEAQVEWIAARELDKPVERYFTAFEKKATAAGYLPREILLVLAYSTRNMPSLDVQYGYDTEKALLLEVYFWKIHTHRDYVTKKFEKDIFPNAVMKRNPGLYHYATSALMACEVRLHGYSGAMARLMALGNKIGYKVHKLIGELAGKEGKKGIKEIRETAKRQAFGPGVDAGKYGGSYGLKLCKTTPKEHWLKNEPTSAPKTNEGDVPSELDADDLSPELEEVL
ncbi:MAG: hypothetical protein H0V66_07620 [Bdellovibrionales bacterium]|nr:hypothetical protein [Bdellovibrionales bacterium]